MKKLSVIAMAERKTELLSGLLRLGCLEISEPDPSLLDEAVRKLFERSDSNLAGVKADINDVATTMGALKEYAGVKEGMFVKREAMSAEEFINDERFLGAIDTSGEINRTVAEIDRLRAEEGRIRSKISALTPWADMDLPLEFRGTEHTRAYKVVCPLGIDIEKVKNEIAEYGASLEILSEDLQQQYGVFICHKDDRQRLVEIMRPYGFGVSTFPDMTGTPKENLSALKVALKKNIVDQKTAEQKIAVEKDEAPDLKILSDRLLVESYVQENQEKLLTDGKIVCFEGWIPAEEEEKVGKFLDEWGAAWETRDPLEEEMDSVPVKLKNNWLTKPLNMVTEMYSLPKYNNVDPNPLMAPFFILFFGLMMADIGYGIMMILAGIVALKKMKPRGNSLAFCQLLLYCGISTLAMGVLTGGLFSDIPYQIVHTLNPDSTWGGLWALFSPERDSTTVLIGSLVLGVLHLNTGMAVSFARKKKAGNIADGIFEEGSLWIMLLGGILMGTKFLGVTEALYKPGLVVLIIGIVMLLFGAGRHEKGFGKVTAAFGCIYNTATGWFGDILSYSRIMALMLAGGVVGKVFNTVAVMPAQGNGINAVTVIAFLIIFLLGHAMNFGLNLLGCYVHDLRLQCLEYFGKFYVDGGRAFDPLSVKTKYVNIKSRT